MKKEDKVSEFIICPRCELNYITKKDKLCPVCKAERGLYDKSILLPDEEEIERLCPVCKVNYLAEDEDICFMCLKEKNSAGRDEVFLGEMDEDDDKLDVDELEISLEHVAEEEEEEEEELFITPDDMDYDEDIDQDDDFDDFDDEDEDDLDDEDDI